MNKITSISFKESYKILCAFKNGEHRILDLEKILDKSGRYSRQIFLGETYKKAKIDAFGGIYWENMAEMRDLEGNVFPCEYDISPDFAYMNSVTVK